MQTLSRLLVVLTASLALTFSTGAAVAAAALVPPGLSGANQYTETLPGPGGNETTGSGGDKHSQSPGQTLGQSNAERLDVLGPEGRAAARLAAAGAPAKVATGKAKAGGASSGVNQVLGNLTGTDDSGGMNGWLLLLIAALAVAAAVYWIRRRKATDGHS